MTDSNKKLSKIDLIKLAREQLVGEFIGQRARDHIQWVKDAEATWKTTGTWLPYPSMPIYPSDSEILARAMELEKYINNESQTPQPTPAPEPQTPNQVIDIVPEEIKQNPQEIEQPNSILDRLSRLKNNWSFK